MAITWTNDKTIKLIELYRQAPCLWKPTDPKHKCANTKHDALQNISVLIGAEIPEIRRKIKNLSGQFSRERMKYRKYKKSGAGAQFMSKWFAYNYMLFVKDKNRVRPCREGGMEDEDLSSNSSGDEIIDDEASSQEDTPQTPQGTDENNPNEETINTASSETAVAGTSHKALNSNLTSSEATPPRQNILDNNKISLQPTPKIQKKIGNTPGRVSSPKIVKNPKMSIQDEQRQEAYAIMKSMYENKTKRDQCDIFGDLVAAKMKKLKTDHARNTVEIMISNILWEASSGKYDYTYCSGLNMAVGTPMHSPSVNSGSDTCSSFGYFQSHPTQPFLASHVDLPQRQNNASPPNNNDILSQAFLNI